MTAEMRQEAGALDQRAHRAEHIGSGVHRLAVDEDRSGVWPNQADQHADDCGLSRTVRPEQPEDLASLCAEGHAVDRPEPVTVGLDDIANDERNTSQCRVHSESRGACATGEAQQSLKQRPAQPPQ